jgi:hypothetical protein
MNSITTDDLWKRLKEPNTIGIALSKEQDTTRLLEAILMAAKKITNAASRENKCQFKPG